LSSGYINGVTKNAQSNNPFTDVEFFQTDASINTGNSGGPIFNLKGEVVGVVSQILTRSGGFEGIGFAATSNVAKRLLLEQEVFWSGMEVVPLTGALAKALNVTQASGLLVQRVALRTPASYIGLRGGNIEAIISDQRILLGGDIILLINGTEFNLSDATLNEIVKNAKKPNAGKTLTMEVLREGRRIILK
jgi:serine protease Do